ncbi:MAG: cytochrome c [Candidatus Sulfotelmatobacter sp.]
MNRFTLVLPALCLFAIPLTAQQQPSTPSAPNSSSYAAIPVEAAKAPNPVKSSPESLARAKKWWALDCAMCHGANGDGKGETAKDMKLNMADFTNPNTMKDRSDGEIYYIIKNGHNDMPAEGPRIKTEEGWDLVNYVRAFAKGKDKDKDKEADTKPQ